MKFFKTSAMPLLVGIYMLISTPVAAEQLPRAFTPREMFSRGAIRGQQQRRRQKVRQLRIQDARMPRDIRAMSPVPIGQPGDARPEILDNLRRDRTRFIAGGWMWNSGAISTYSGMTGPTKGASYSFGSSIEYEITDPEGVTIQQEMPIVEWWEVSERSRGQRSEFFRARFGASQQLQIMPAEGAEQSQQPGQTEVSPPGGGGMMPGGTGPPGGGAPQEEFF